MSAVPDADQRRVRLLGGLPLLLLLPAHSRALPGRLRRAFRPLAFTPPYHTTPHRTTPYTARLTNEATNYSSDIYIIHLIIFSFEYYSLLFLQVGFVSAAGSLVCSLSALPISFLAGAIGRGPVILLGAIAFAAIAAWCVQSNQRPQPNPTQPTAPQNNTNQTKPKNLFIESNILAAILFLKFLFVHDST